MVTNTHIGRPKRYESPAEKQKAYRERQKMAQMPEVVLRNKVDTLAATLLEANRACDNHRAAFMKVTEESYKEWLAESIRLQGAWWKVHGEHYLAVLELNAHQHEGEHRKWFEFQNRQRR